MANIYLKASTVEDLMLTRTTKLDFGIEEKNINAVVTIEMNTGRLTTSTHEWSATIPVDEIMGIAQRQLHEFAIRLAEQTKKWAAPEETA